MNRKTFINTLNNETVVVLCTEGMNLEAATSIAAFNLEADKADVQLVSTDVLTFQTQAKIVVGDKTVLSYAVEHNAHNAAVVKQAIIHELCQQDVTQEFVKLVDEALDSKTFFMAKAHKEVRVTYKVEMVEAPALSVEF